MGAIRTAGEVCGDIGPKSAECKEMNKRVHLMFHRGLFGALCAR